MKRIIVIAGTGLIGSKVVTCLADYGHDVVAAAPELGVDTLTGEGLDRALAGADVVVDVSEATSFDETLAQTFLLTTTRNVLAAEAGAGVGHHVGLSVVGTQRLWESGYFRVKIAQEKLIKKSAIPFSIVHATQAFEAIKDIADASTMNGSVRLPSVLVQPMAADDVAKAVSRAAINPPVNGVVEIAGPQYMRLDELVRRCLIDHGDPREVITDRTARYLGAELSELMLTAEDDARLAAIRYEEWLRSSGAGERDETSARTR
jgi:uncharacterized protein YbjT (DUF2867 family)